MDYKDFMEYAFQKLYERGWLTELIPSSITETDIAEFEQEYLMELPVILKLYLMAYKPSPTDIVGMVYDENKEIKIDTIDFYDLTDDISDWSESLECFREEFEDCETPLREEIYRNLFPIGYMDGWYCLDLSQSDGKDCPVVFLEYGGFWDCYCDADGILHGKCIASNFCTFLEWYFCGSLEPEYEKINHVTVNHEFYSMWHNQHFISELNLTHLPLV